MHSDHPEVRHHKKPVMQRFEGVLGPVMVVVVIALAIGMIYTIATGDQPPSWMQ